MSTIYIKYLKQICFYVCIHNICIHTCIYIYIYRYNIHMELHMELHMCSYVYTTFYVSNLSNFKGIRTEQSGISCDGSSRGVIPLYSIQAFRSNFEHKHMPHALSSKRKTSRPLQSRIVFVQYLYMFFEYSPQISGFVTTWP